MCKALCVLYGERFAGAKGLKIHQTCATRYLRTRIKRGPSVPPVSPNLIYIEDYSLDYLMILADLLQNIQNEQLVDGRYQSLIKFSDNVRAIQRQKQLGATAKLIKGVDFISSSAFWETRLYCLAKYGVCFILQFCRQMFCNCQLFCYGIKKEL